MPLFLLTKEKGARLGTKKKRMTSSSVELREKMKINNKSKLLAGLAWFAPIIASVPINLTNQNDEFVKTHSFNATVFGIILVVSYVASLAISMTAPRIDQGVGLLLSALFFLLILLSALTGRGGGSSPYDWSSTLQSWVLFIFFIVWLYNLSKVYKGKK